MAGRCRLWSSASFSLGRHLQYLFCRRLGRLGPVLRGFVCPKCSRSGLRRHSGDFPTTYLVIIRSALLYRVGRCSDGFEHCCCAMTKAESDCRTAGSDIRERRLVLEGRLGASENRLMRTTWPYHARRCAVDFAHAASADGGNRFAGSQLRPRRQRHTVMCDSPLRDTGIRIGDEVAHVADVRQVKGKS